MRKQKRTSLPQQNTNSSLPPQNISSSLFSGVLQGFSFGTGSSIAHNLFNSNPTQKKEPCEILKQQYFDTCNLHSMSEPNRCQQLYQDLQLICSKQKYET